MHQASEFLTKQIETTKAEVEASQEQLNHYGESRDIVNTADASNVTVQKMNQLNSDFTNAQNDRIQKAAAYDAIVHASADTIGANDSLVLQLSAELSRLERDYAQKLNVYRPEHPDMLALRTQVEKTRQARQNALLTAYAQRRDLARSDADPILRFASHTHPLGLGSSAGLSCAAVSRLGKRTGMGL